MEKEMISKLSKLFEKFPRVNAFISMLLSIFCLSLGLKILASTILTEPGRTALSGMKYYDKIESGMINVDSAFSFSYLFSENRVFWCLLFLGTIFLILLVADLIHLNENENENENDSE